MGKPTGFKEFERQAVPYRDPVERAGDFLEIFTAPAETQLRTQGARCMDCGVPFCQSDIRLPDRQSHSRVERPGLSGPLAGRARSAAQDEQLPRVHRPHLPGPVRRGVRAGHHRSAGHDQEHRERDHRPRLRRRLGHAAAAAAADRQARGDRRQRPGRAGRRRAAQQGRPPGHRLRAGRPHRRPADVRHPEHEARQGRRPAADRSAGRRGRRVRHLRPRRPAGGFPSRPHDADHARARLPGEVHRPEPAAGRQRRRAAGHRRDEIVRPDRPAAPAAT